MQKVKKYKQFNLTKFNREKRMLIKVTKKSTIFIVLTIMSFISSCNHNTNTKAITGKWANKSLRRPIYLTIENDSSYILSVLNGKFEFNGNYKIDKKQIELIDTYCGTKLPGIYEMIIEKGNLVFTLVSDEYCERKKFLPGKWERVENDSVDTQSTVKNDNDSAIQELIQ